MPFHRSTTGALEAPRPNVNRPGAASAIAATDWASRAAPLVNAGVTATPSWSLGSHAAASASGVKPSVPSTSADQTSV